MSEIRLTCGGCNKRYRLPAGSVGYFRCRRCDLVMAIPGATPEAAKSDAAQADGVPVVPVQPAVPAQPAPWQTPQYPAAPADPLSLPPAATPYSFGHVKKQVLLQPADIGAVAVGVMLLLGGLFVVLLQLGRGDEPVSLVAVVIGAMVALGGVAALGIGLRRLQKLMLPLTVVTSLLTVALCVAALVPAGEPKNQRAESTPNQKTIDPEVPTDSGDHDANTSSSASPTGESGRSTPDNRPRRSRPDRSTSDSDAGENPFKEVTSPFREVSPDEETGGTPDRSRKRSPRNLNRGAITFDEFRSRTPRNQ
ncbi:MAG: hypothetical protein ACR2NP_11985, partial [Pirellulaceae bacterium]